MLRLPYWIFFIPAILALGVAAYLYLAARDPIPGPGSDAFLGDGAPVDLVDISADEHIGPEGEIALMAQVNERLTQELEGVTEEGEGRIYYALFSAFSDEDDTLARAVLVTKERTKLEEWLRARSIGSAQMGPLYHLYGYTFLDRRIKSAVVGSLSEAGLSTSQNFLMIEAPFDADRPQKYVEPTRAELVFPVLLMAVSGVLMVIGLHLRSLTRKREKAEDAFLWDDEDS